MKSKVQATGKARVVSLIVVVVALVFAAGIATASMTMQPNGEPQVLQEQAIITADPANGIIDVSEQASYIWGDFFVGVVPLSETASIALEWQVGDLQAWMDSVVGKRAEDSIDEMLVRILDDDTNTYLTPRQKIDFGTACMTEYDTYVITYDRIPDELVAVVIKQADLNLAVAEK